VKAQAKDISQQNRRASHTLPSNPTKENRNGQQKGKAQQGAENGSKSAGATHNGSWQQQPPRNGRNTKKNKKKSAEQKSPGEPLPANAADRKGG